MTRVWTITIGTEWLRDENDEVVSFARKSDALREAARLERERPLATVRVVPSALEDL